MTWTTAGRPSAPPAEEGSGAGSAAEDGPAAARRGARTAVRAGVLVVLLASGALALTACSSGAKPSSDAKAATPSGSASAQSAGNGNSQAMEAYRTCLAQHGVKLPAFHRPTGGARPSGRPGDRPSDWPSGRPSGFGGGSGRGFGGFPGAGGASPDAATRKALQACASQRPQFNGGGPGGADSSAFQAFTSCLKDHGVTLPTPSPGAATAHGGHGFLRGGGLNTADPKTARAYAVCKPLLPQRPSDGPSPSAT